jgi:hypothetical protein
LPSYSLLLSILCATCITYNYASLAVLLLLLITFLIPARLSVLVGCTDLSGRQSFTLRNHAAAALLSPFVSPTLKALHGV